MKYYLSVPYDKARKSVKKNHDGLWGLFLQDGTEVLPPEFDKIEFCRDFIYAHYENRHIEFYKGGSTDYRDEETDYRFYENGHIGLRDKDGNIFLPAVYDEITDWGEGCDVIYVRRGSEFHYYNHDKKEILTEYDNIKEDKYPLVPYSLAEDQNREVLICVEPSDSHEGGNICYACNQWVRLSRIPCRKIGAMFTNSKLYSVSGRVMSHFYDESTYIYSARICRSKGKNALMSCINKMKSLECYDSSWDYLVRISTNSNTHLSNEELYECICFYEDLIDGYRFDIALDINEGLEDGEVELFQVHYFWDGGPGFLSDEFLQYWLPQGSLEGIKQLVESSDNPKEKLKDAYQWIDCDTKREWKETKKVLDYIKNHGEVTPTTLISECDFNKFYVDEYTEQYWNNKRNIILWSIANGGYLNYVSHGKTPLDQVREEISEARSFGCEESKLHYAKDFEKFLIQIGARTTTEERSYVKSELNGITPEELLKLMEKTKTLAY